MLLYQYCLCCHCCRLLIDCCLSPSFSPSPFLSPFLSPSPFPYFSPSPSLSLSPSPLSLPIFLSFPPLFLLSLPPVLLSLSLSLSHFYSSPPSIVSVPVSNVNYYGEGKGPIHLNFVTCRGSESRLIDCRYSFDTRFYSHAQDAGLICYNGTTGKPYLNSLYRNWFFYMLT